MPPLLQISIVTVETRIVNFFKLPTTDSCILTCEKLYTIMLYSLWEIIPKKIGNQMILYKLRLLFVLFFLQCVWRIRYVDIVWGGEVKCFKTPLAILNTSQFFKTY